MWIIDSLLCTLTWHWHATQLSISQLVTIGSGRRTCSPHGGCRSRYPRHSPIARKFSGFSSDPAMPGRRGRRKTLGGPPVTSSTQPLSVSSSSSLLASELSTPAVLAVSLLYTPFPHALALLPHALALLPHALAFLPHALALYLPHSPAPHSPPQTHHPLTTVVVARVEVEASSDEVEK